METSAATSRVARLYQVLAYVKTFPVPLRTIAIVSGMAEDEIRQTIASTLFTVIDDQIQPLTEIKRLEQLTASEADFLYQTNGLAFYCKDGRPFWMQIEGYADDALYNSVELLAWRLGEARRRI